MSILDIIDRKGNKVNSFGMSDKIGYALGDLGCGLFFQFVSSYLMLFYTDVFGISAVAVGTLFIIARVWDAINDPIMGVIADRNKNTKHGKFRPYVVVYGIPLVLVGILSFTSIPGLPESFKLPYAYITYIAFGMLYTAVNIPYGSLASVMTSDPVERTSLSTFRTLGSIVSGVVIMLAVPKIIFTNGQVTAAGFVKCAVIFAIVSAICYIFTFRLTTERISIKVDEDKKQTISQTIKMLFKNRAFIGITLGSFFVTTSMFIGTSLNAYLFKEYFKNPDLITLAGVAGMLPMFAVFPVVGKLVKVFGKKEVSVAGTALSMVVYGILFILPITDPYVYIGLVVVAGIGTGIVSVVTWALVADAIDYQEYISGERNEGTVYSSYSLFRKLGQAVSGGVGGFALGMLGYQAGADAQTQAVGIGIKNIVTGANFVGLALSLVAMAFIFNLSKKKLAEVTEELNRRREIA